MKSIIPFKVNYSPIKKLAIIPFENKPDKIYKGFELQYIDGKPYGKGYRIIAYRVDNFVDVYDDYSLKLQASEKFNVAEKGLNKHIQVSINNVHFEKQCDCEHISFEFIDIENRNIKFNIKEHSRRKTIPMNLLAPIGYGSLNPNFLPLFFMYDFDFIRKKGTQADCKIDNKMIDIDTFPLPMNMQFRYYARYSNYCELLEFINSDERNLIEVELNNNTYIDKNIKYIFDNVNALSNVIVKTDEGLIDISFIPSLDLTRDLQGTFKITPKKEMGYLKGIYEIKQKNNMILIKLVPHNGWNSVPNSLITKMILNSKSMFCKWSKNYEYISEIDVSKKKIKSKWYNHNLKKEK